MILANPLQSATTSSSSSSSTRSRRVSSRAQSTPLPATTAATTLFMTLHLCLAVVASFRSISSCALNLGSFVISSRCAWTFLARAMSVVVRVRFFSIARVLSADSTATSFNKVCRVEDKLVRTISRMSLRSIRGRRALEAISVCVAPMECPSSTSR